LTSGQTDLFITGIANQLQVGDVLLFVGSTRIGNPLDSNWDVRTLVTVETSPATAQTRVTWTGGLRAVAPAAVFVFRRRAALFGHNAPHFGVLPAEIKTTFDPTAGNSSGDWPTAIYDLNSTSDELVNHRVDLDIDDPKIITGGWIALAAPGPGGPQATQGTLATSPFVPGGADAFFPLRILDDETTPTAQPTATVITNVGLYQAQPAPSILTRAGFGMSGTVTRVPLDTTDGINGLRRRDALFFVESEALALGRRPVTTPVDGNYELPGGPTATGPTGPFVTLASPGADLDVGRKVALTGKRAFLRPLGDPVLSQRLAATILVQDPFSLCTTALSTIRAQVSTVMIADDGTGRSEDVVGLALELLDPPTQQPSLAASCSPYSNLTVAVTVPMLRWHVRSPTGLSGFVDLPLEALIHIPAPTSAQAISEIGQVAAITNTGTRTVLELARPIQHIYDRASLTVSGNVAAATHGETVANEVLGNGDATTANQLFVLKRPPLTYVPSDANASGAVSTINVSIGGVKWQEVPALFGEPPGARVFTLRRTDAGDTNVIFGDGVQGSRLPTGAGNVVATYRTGIGPDGEVDAGVLTLPVVRPLGIRGVNNPVAATGAASPASIDDARTNAPLTITTLGRAVSTRDVENFARAFLGVGKAQAVLLWNGSSQIIHVTIGTSSGEPVPAGAPLLDHLASALRQEGDPALLFEIDTYDQLEFRVSLAVAVDPSRQEDDVHQAVKQALIDTFSFAERDFGQPVTAAEVLTAAQRVPGVVAVNIDLLYLTVPSKQDALPSQPARFDGAATTRAQLLVVDPAGITITELATT
jgi:hypothetical protein